MPSFNDLSSDQLVRHNIQLMRFDAKLRRQIRGMLHKLQNELIQQLSVVDFSNVAKQQRLQSLLSQVNAATKKTYTKMSSHMLNEMGDLAGLEHSFAASSLNSLMKVDILSASLTPQALRAMAKKSVVQGAPAAEWWSRQSVNMQRRFSDEMRNGFLLGEGTGDLVRRVRGTATGARQIVEIGGKAKSVAVFEGGIMNVTTRQAEALVRTSVQSIANEARLATYMENTDVIQAVYAQVTLDSKTTAICQAHGAGPDEWSLPDFEPIGASNPYSGPPPWHYNCRSSLAPITKSWDKLQREANGPNATRSQRRVARKLDNNAPKAMRSSMDGQVPKGTGYGEWLNGQPKKVQLEALGPGKHKLWKQGHLNLSQMINQTGRPLSLGQIERQLAGESLGLTNLPSGSKIRRAKDHAFTGQFDVTLTNGMKHKIFRSEADKQWYESLVGTPDKILLAKTKLKAIEQLEIRAGLKTKTTVKTVKKKKITGTKNDKGTITRRADDFETTGEYNVTLTDSQTFRMYRDPDTGWWYEALPTNTLRQSPLGFNQKEAIAALEKRLKTKTIIKKKKVVKKKPVKKKKPVIPPPAAPVVESINYRSLEIGDIWKDLDGNTWKVFKKTNQGIRNFPWSKTKGRFLTAKGKSFRFTEPAAKTVKQFKQSTVNASAEIQKVMPFDKFKGAGYEWSTTQLHAMEESIELMGKNGYNKQLAVMLKRRKFKVGTFNMGGSKTGSNKMVDLFGRRSKSNHLGSYWDSHSTIGIREGMDLAGTRHTIVHEFGHHMDFTIFRKQIQMMTRSGEGEFGVRVFRRLSVEAQERMDTLNKAYEAALKEYAAASNAVGKKLSLRMKKASVGHGTAAEADFSVMSFKQQRKNWHRIAKEMEGLAQSSYSLANDMEWFAESFAHYFNQRGSRALMKKISPRTYELFQALFSKDMEILWKELL